MANKTNLLLTKAAIWTYLMAAGTFVGILAPKIAPLAIGYIDRHVTNEVRRADFKDGVQVILEIIGAATTITGGVGVLAARYDRGDTYTPKYLPGEDPPHRNQEG